MAPRAFRSAADFRAWLERNHDKSKELILRCYRVHAKHRGATYREALDEALCFGWIDGVRRACDEDSFTQRFSPRRKGSNWSAVNIRRAKQLEAEGRMHPAGLSAFHGRKKGQDAGPPRHDSLPASARGALRANRRAWAFFQKKPPGYRRLCARWVMDAKREETRDRRLKTLIECCAQGRLIPGMEALMRPKRTRDS